MSLPYELTTLPSNALTIIRFLGQCDNYAAFDNEIIEALALSERGFGKAIRRLVTRDYVEMQYEGTYSLTEQGISAAEAIEEHGAEAIHQAVETDTAPFTAEMPLEDTATRCLIVVFPKTLAAGQPAYVFLRVDAPSLEEDQITAPVDVLFRLKTDCAVAPAQRDVTIPVDEASSAVRFEVTPPGTGDFPTQLEVVQVGEVDLIEAGVFEITLSATETLTDTFVALNFDLALHIGV